MTNLISVRRVLLALGICLWAAANAALAADPDLARAEALIKEGKAAEAYLLLEPFEFEQSGNVKFDNLLGVAALDSGKPDKATIAFERVLAVDPNSAGTRLDMARAYFALGDYAGAKKELQTVSELNPPPAAKAVIEKYLVAIDEKERQKRTAITGYVEGAFGRDNNITSVVGDFTRAVLTTYNLPGFQPTGSAIKRASNIMATAGGMEVNHKIDDALALYAGADGRYRGVVSADNYTSEQLDARGGLMYTRNANVFRGGLSYQDYRQRTDTVGMTANRNSIGLSTEWRRTLGANDQTGLFGVYTQQRFQDVPTNDIDSYMLGGNWLHVFEGEVKPMLYSSLFTGRDDARNKLANGADVGKRNIGARFYVQVPAHENVDVFSSIGYLERFDRAEYARAVAVQYGKDRITDVTLGLNWRPAKDWTVRPQITQSANRSNVALSEYNRTEAIVTVRYDFH